MLKHLSKIVAVFAIAAVIIPSFAFARGGDDDRHGDDRRGAWVTNQFGVKVFGSSVDSDTEVKVENDDNNDRDRGNRFFGDFRRNSKAEGDKDNGWHLGHHKKGFVHDMFHNGTVTATSDTGFTIEAKDGRDLTVDADSATIIQIPRTTISLDDINVGDKVHITGTESEGSITAKVVYVMPANWHPAIAKGEITAVTDDTITVQTDEDSTITVNTNSDTQFVDENGDAATQSDVEVGMTAKLKGFWDSVLNVFNAVKVRLS